MKKIGVVLVLMTLVLLVGCDSRYYTEPTGQLSERSFNIESFNELDVSSAFKVVVTKGDYSVNVQMDESYIEDLLVEERGGVLKIGLKPGFRWNMFGSEMIATVSMPELSGIDASGATQVFVKQDMVYSEDLSINLSGAAYMEANIITERIYFDLSGASHFEGTVETEDLRVGVSGASALDIEGKADITHVEASGASRFNNKHFITQELNVDVSGASSVSIGVNDKAKVQASGASTINLSGSPQVTSQDVDMTSTLNLN